VLFRSQTGFVAIKSGDAASVNQAIQSIAPMVGLASRDFLGNTIWSAPAGGFVQIPTIGVGGGHIFIGPETAIENALRANEGGLADEQGFQDAVAPLGGTAMAFGFTDIRKAMEYAEWTMKNTRSMIEAKVNAMPGIEELGPEFKQQIIDEQMAAVPEFMQDLPSLDAITENIGNGAFEMHSTDEGFTGRWLMHRPE